MENEKKDPQQQTQTAMVPVSFNLLDPQQFATMQRVCKVYASSDMVPDIYRATSTENEIKAIGNCMIAIEIAMRTNASVLMVMQNLVPIHGKPSWSSKFLIASVNACGRFDQLQYKMENLGKIGVVEYTVYDKVWETSSTGKKYQKNVARTEKFDGTNVDNIQCIAYTSQKGKTDVLESSPVSILMAVKEGWYTKNGSKWQTMPIKMLKYRAASFWTNEHAPEISMGIRTIEEQEDMGEVQDAECEIISTKLNGAPRKKVDIPTDGKQNEQPKPAQPAAPQKPAEPVKPQEPVKPAPAQPDGEAEEGPGY